LPLIIKSLLACALLTSSAAAAPRQTEPSPDTERREELKARGAWSLTTYWAVMTPEKTGDALLPPTELDTSFTFVAFALNRRLTTWFDKIDIELEGQAVKHLGSQTHNEFNALATGRWIRFPWNGYVATTVALGGGASYASEIPIFESITHETTSQWLAYALLEVTLAPPQSSHWAFVFRAHHRSGANGTFGGVRGASDALGLGIKFRW